MIVRSNITGSYVTKRDVVLGAMGGRGRSETTISISNGGAELIDYQVRILLTSQNFTFISADGADIRVFDSDNATILPYFVKSYDQTGKTAEVWARIPSIPAAGSKTIFIKKSSERFTIPPVGPWTRPAAAIGVGSAENMVYDDATNAYYVVTGQGTDGPIQLWTAANIDGTWTNLGTILNVGGAGTWDALYVESPCLFKSGATWYLYYAGFPTGQNYNFGKIGYATASAITGPYTKFASNPVVDVGDVGAWDHYLAFEPYIFQVSSTWYMFYCGDSGGFGNRLEQVGYATSSNPGGPWTKYANNPVLTFGTAPDLDALTVADPFVYGPVNGEYFIGYSGGPTQTYPWSLFMARTRDFVTFTKVGKFYDYGTVGAWDEKDAHRGAITRVGDTYYMPYLGFNAALDRQWAIASMSALNSISGYPPSLVFDFYDDFSAALDANVWLAASGVGSDSVSSGVLTLQTGGAGTRTRVARKKFLHGYITEFLSRHPHAASATVASEVGMSLIDRTQLIKQLDLSLSVWRNSSMKDSIETLVNSAVPFDTGWNVHSIAYATTSLVRYRVNENAWEEITTNVPLVSLPPWIFVYSASGQNVTIDVDWVRVRKYANPEPVITIV